QSHFSLTVGTAVSHYKIVSKIGSGGMGEVWLAEDTKLNRRVALKFMPAHAASDASLKARFTREAQAAAKLDHPNIVPVYEVGEFQGRPFFAMAHIEGQSLREVIKQGKLSVSEAIELTMQICEGLNEAHNEGVVHRDIKPGNIIIDTKGRPRILDFGLATVAGDDKLTKTGSTLGTVGYMSPEQVEGKQVDHRTDLFSVGVILYEMLTGRRPFEGDNDAAVARAITDTHPEPVARFKSGVTGELQQIVDKALTKDPSLRYQHADGMLADLKRLTTEPVSVKRSRLRWWIAAAVVCCVAGYFVVDRVITSSGEIEGWSNSVAVLVFRDLSTNQDQDAFCEGMTEEIIGRLQSIRQLKVISTQSMLRFKGSDLDLKAIGKELAVDNILAGSVQKEGDSIRVRAELVSVEDDVSIWSDRYYREFNSAWAVQEDISRAIAEVLEMELTGEETTALVSRGTDDIEAYNAYLQGRFFWRKRAEIHLRRSIEFFERAIELDPDYALAYSGLCDAWRQLRSYGISSPAEEEEAIAKADSAAERAFELNENLAEVQASMAGVHTRRYYGPDGTADDLARAEQGYQKAIEINPGYVWAHLWYSSLLRQAGRDEEWKRELMIAYELDPLAAVVLANLAHYHRHFGDNAKAKEIYLRIVDLEPSFPNVYGDLAWVYSGEGQVDSALMMAEKYAEASPELFYRPYLLKAGLLRTSSRFDEAEAMYLRSIELAPERSRPYAYYGDFLRRMQRWGEAVQYFEKATDLGSNEAWVHRDYGDLLGLQLGRHAEGLKQLFRAVELNPRDVSAYNSMAYTYDIVGNADSAIWAADMAVEVSPNDWWLGNSLDTRADMYSRDGRFD
ncbi:MAG: protein kinase, partial [Candidatus Zixiibacteriota bacterium]